MKEEDIDNRIERVIKSVGAKRAEMARWAEEREGREKREKREENFASRSSSRKWLRYGIPVAASLVVVCSIGLGILFTRVGSGSESSRGFGSSSTSVYVTFRGGASAEHNIIALMDSARYEEALELVNEELADTAIPADYTIERRAYIKQVNQARDYQLTWLKVEILLKEERIEEAKEILDGYRHLHGEHQEEALKIYKQICK